MITGKRPEAQKVKGQTHTATGVVWALLSVGLVFLQIRSEAQMRFSLLANTIVINRLRK